MYFDPLNSVVQDQSEEMWHNSHYFRLNFNRKATKSTRNHRECKKALSLAYLSWIRTFYKENMLQLMKIRGKITNIWAIEWSTIKRRIFIVFFFRLLEVNLIFFCNKIHPSSEAHAIVSSQICWICVLYDSLDILQTVEFTEKFCWE